MIKLSLPNNDEKIIFIWPEGIFPDISQKELKEFSILFLIINNLEVFRKNIELISKVSFDNSLLSEFKEKIIDFLLAEEFFDRKKLFY